ncbi:alpha/beta fold hydrolase [Roseomonas sp. GC11]|uniref:alpha/beta fold hydrolase n=1 Tax=Roseomonas sp. GC11 TaxID=2950546 RepID=UPI00210E7855|nr:alpha/beta fold hydrolase [Roseomonas sp. GC11]MCQ4161230.1 alpha/beta fold hydrolase [Roseomonas sp. GC11]
MTRASLTRRAALLAGLALAAAPAAAAEMPAPQEGLWVARNFRFHTGETLPELRLGYTTLGKPDGIPVLVLHGTAGSARSLLTPAFAGNLFDPGQPLDASRYYIIIPDALGAGRSAKPSDGLRAAFPRYNYDDMVQAQYRLLTEGLGVRHLGLVLGHSMGGMHAWLWGVTYPEFMDALVPMASQPTAMSGRNWMMRRLQVEMIRRDPAYQGGNYTEQPPALRLANVVYGTATNGGTLNLQAAAPDSAAADRLVEARLAAPPPSDANDFIYQWEASRDYNPEPLLGRIKARVLAINAADDERNPPETGLMQAAMQRIPRARLLLIPASEKTLGHGTTGNAGFFAEDLRRFLAAAE